jgi:hypothetical protein
MNRQQQEHKRQAPLFGPETEEPKENTPCALFSFGHGNQPRLLLHQVQWLQFSISVFYCQLDSKLHSDEHVDPLCYNVVIHSRSHPW